MSLIFTRTQISPVFKINETRPQTQRLWQYAFIGGTQHDYNVRSREHTHSEKCSCEDQVNSQQKDIPEMKLERGIN